MAESTSVARLTLTDFRNYAGLRLDLGPGPIVLAGANGAGKTNLLEAVSLLAPGRGLRAASYGELARIGGSGSWAVAARVSSDGDERTIGTAWQPDPEAAGAAREISIDGVP